MTTASPPIRIVHSSDLHVDDGYTQRAWGGDGNAPLAAVLDAARSANADLVLLTGDVFEHNRLDAAVLERTAELLAGAGRPVVMLPGNHDPLTDDSVWYRGGFVGIANVRVLGAGSDSATFEELDLAVWGRAHVDYDDMTPLADPSPRLAGRHIAVAHGHFVETRPAPGRPGPAWLITADDIEATGADYVALGHWNVRTKVGTGTVPAFYSGSPDYARSANLVVCGNNGVRVSALKVAANTTRVGP